MKIPFICWTTSTLRSVIAIILNFWLSTFRLSNRCLEEVESLCSAFLWSGPELNHRKTKVVWKDVCKPKKEGFLGLKSLKEANKVSCLKLIWRLVSDQPTIWVLWMKITLLHHNSFWTIKENTTKDSWMWRKIFKYREFAKDFIKWR